jgi:hypothetical protein
VFQLSVKSSLNRILSHATSAGAATLALLGGATSPALAAPARARVIEPQTVATFPALSSDDAWTLYEFPNSLLRADGSFGYFAQRYAAPHDDVPMELTTYGGPVAPGQFRKQNIDGAPGGTLPYPGLTASGVDGYDWVFDHAEWRLPKPGEQPDSYSGWVPVTPSLLAIDDRGRVAKRASLDFGPRTFTKALVPTGAGLLVIVRTTDSGLDVRKSTGKLLAHISQLSELRSAVGQPDGSLLLSGYREHGVAGSWSNALIKVSATGNISRVRDNHRGRIVATPLAATRRGVVLSPDDEYFRDVAVLSDRGRLQHRKLSELKLPWSADCRSSRDGFSLAWAMAGPTGDPVIAVTCYRSGDRMDVTLDSFTVGLDGQLRAAWAVRGTALPRIGPDGRLYQVDYQNTDGNYSLVAWRVPGSPQPRRGHVVSVRQDGGGGVVTIRCSRPEGTVCSGTAHLTRAGSEEQTLSYALRGRPGKAGAVILRHFDVAPPGQGQLHANLTR